MLDCKGGHRAFHHNPVSAAESRPLLLDNGAWRSRLDNGAWRSREEIWPRLLSRLWWEEIGGGAEGFRLDGREERIFRGRGEQSVGAAEPGLGGTLDGGEFLLWDGGES